MIALQGKALVLCIFGRFWESATPKNVQKLVEKRQRKTKKDNLLPFPVKKRRFQHDLLPKTSKNIFTPKNVQGVLLPEKKVFF